MSLFGVIFSRRLAESLASQPGAHLHTSNGQLDPATINQLPALIRHAAFVGISHGIDGVFIWAVPTAALVFVLAWLIKEIPLRGQNESPAEPVAPSEPEFVGQRSPATPTP